MSQIEIVYFVTDIDRISHNCRDLLIRFNVYAEKLTNSDPLARFVLVTNEDVANSLVQISVDFPFLEIILIKNSGRNVIKQIVYLNKSLNWEIDKLIIPANNFDNFLSLLILRIYRKFNIQLAIHGEIQSLFKISSLKQLFKQIWLITTIKFVKSIRVVSHFEKINLSKFYKVESRRIVVCPVPIILGSKLISNKSNIRAIAYIGRFHFERNPDLWIKILSHEYLRNYRIEVFIAGKGKLKPDFLMRINALNNVMAIDLGNLSQSELQIVWPRIGLLLSTANQEGYGLAIREAILNDTYVLAKKSHGALNLKTEAADDIIRLFDTVDEAAKYLKDFFDGKWCNGQFSDYKSRYSFEFQESLNDLINSWLSKNRAF